MVQLQEHETLESWLAALPEKAKNTDGVQKLSTGIGELPRTSFCGGVTKGMKSYSEQQLHDTYLQPDSHHVTFEKAWWNDIHKLSSG